jgi:hypothetical protein
VDVSVAVVLVVGAATVIVMALQTASQRAAAGRMADLVERQTAAAERQVEAAEQQAAAAHAQARVLETQSKRELEATIVAVFGGGSPQQQAVRLMNGGRHPASRISARYREEGGEFETPAASHGVLMPGENVQLELQTPIDRVRTGQPLLRLSVVYEDGLGDHEVEPGLTAHQF